MQHANEHNWFALTLDFVVVVVGIFLALQIERWYAEERAQKESIDRVGSLLDDFLYNRDILDQSIQSRLSVIDASQKLLDMDEKSPSSDDHEDFYKFLSAASITSTPRFHRGAYDVLISTGDIDLIADPTVSAELADFFARLDEFIIYNQGSWLVHRNTFEPYVIKTLDYVEMLQYLHPKDGNHGIEQSRTNQTREAFLEPLGSPEFEGIIGAKWHVARDEIVRLERLRDRLTQIEDRLARVVSSYQ